MTDILYLIFIWYWKCQEILWDPIGHFEWCHLIKLAPSNLGYWEYIFITHLVIIIKSEVSTFPIFIIFFHGCVPAVVVPSYAYHHMLLISYISQECWVLFLLLLCSLMMCTNNQVHIGPMVISVCLHIILPHYHHYAEVPEDMEFLKYLSSIF